MTDLRTAAQQALERLRKYHYGNGFAEDAECIADLEAALAQQAEPTVTEDMKSAVRWAPSSAYWSERLREFFGPDAREGIDALERRLAKAQQAEPVRSPSTPQEKEMTDPNSVCFSLNTGAFPVEMLRLDGSGFHYKGKVIEDAGEAYNLFKQWLVMAQQPSQEAEPVEPVAWKQGNLVTFNEDPYPALGGLFVQFWDGEEVAARVYANDLKTLRQRCAKVYTAPPQRTMVPLTEEEIYHATGHCGVSKYTAINIARVIEEASWEKNHGQA